MREILSVRLEARITKNAHHGRGISGCLGFAAPGRCASDEVIAQACKTLSVHG